MRSALEAWILRHVWDSNCDSKIVHNVHQKCAMGQRKCAHKLLQFMDKKLCVTKIVQLCNLGKEFAIYSVNLGKGASTNCREMMIDF